MARLLLTCALLVITVSVSRVYANDLPSPFLEAVKRLKLNKKISYIPDRITQLKNIEDDLPGRLRKRQSYACSKAYREAQSPRVEQCLPYLADEGRYTSNTQVAAFCRLECDTILKQVFTDLYACEGSSSDQAEIKILDFFCKQNARGTYCLVAFNDIDNFHPGVTCDHTSSHCTSNCRTITSWINYHLGCCYETLQQLNEISPDSGDDLPSQIFRVCGYTSAITACH
ncbi:uncharacterized protein [Dysidea avara]|uniref:uncharacterized protein n=1 Tax=Dysidea avara TaxID=196820 RepID=UPI00332E4CDE